MMFKQQLQTAHISGGELIVTIRTQPSSRYQGKIMEVRDGFFTLFHSGSGGGVLWTFRINDIASCGLLIEVPELQDDGNMRPQPLRGAPVLQQENDDDENGEFRCRKKGD